MSLNLSFNSVICLSKHNKWSVGQFQEMTEFKIGINKMVTLKINPSKLPVSLNHKILNLINLIKCTFYKNIDMLCIYFFTFACYGN